MSRQNQPDPITPLLCSVPGCRYSTPVGIPDMPTVVQLLNMHDTQAHAVDRLREQTRLGEQQPPAPAPTTAATPAPSKAPARPRPMVNEDFSEADWQFFLSEWQSHKRALNISQTVHVLDELRICMGDKLRRIFHDQHGAQDNEQTMLERMKDLAVESQHPAYHAVVLHSASQLDGESFKIHAARIKGLANRCQLSQPCTATNHCGGSFLEKLFSMSFWPEFQTQN